MSKRKNDSDGLLLQPASLPCPWCGKLPRHETRVVGGPGIEPTRLHWYACPECNIAHPVGEATPAGALLKWNRRHSKPGILGSATREVVSWKKDRRIIVMSLGLHSYAAALDMPDLDAVLRSDGNSPEQALARLESNVTDCMPAIKTLQANRLAGSEKTSPPKLTVLGEKQLAEKPATAEGQPHDKAPGSDLDGGSAGRPSSN